MSHKNLQYYKSLEYNTIIKQEQLDGEKWYIAYCNEFGMNACHGIGEDRIAALKSFVEEKDAFIEMLYENGEMIPEVSQEEQSLSGIFSVRTSPWIHSALTLQAKMNGVSLNSYINQLLSYGVGQCEASLKCERLIKEMDSKITVQNQGLLKSINAISYKTNSLFEDSTKSKFFGNSKYKSAV